MDYFEARYMRASVGRFTTVDPLGASGKLTKPETFNRYAYALNNPLSFLDPSGMEPRPTIPPPLGFEPEDRVRHDQWFEQYNQERQDYWDEQRAYTQQAAGSSQPKPGESVLTEMKKWEGTPYLWGGGRDGNAALARKNGVDCAGLFNLAMLAAGYAYNYNRADLGMVDRNPGMFRILGADERHEAGDVMLWVGVHVGLFDPNPPVRGKTLYGATTHGVHHEDPKYWTGMPVWLRIVGRQ
jgi:hypothetical protein